MSETNEAAKPQKWTERNAAALALVDRLPDELQAHVSIFRNQKIYLGYLERGSIAILKQFLTEFAPDSEVKRSNPRGSGACDQTIKFADGSKLEWTTFVKVITTIVDEE